MNLDGSFVYSQFLTISLDIPQKFALSNNYPNPFNPGTDVEYQLPKSAKVTLTIFNLVGQEVRTLIEEEKSAGVFTVHWDGSDEQGRVVPSGVYIYRLQAGNFVAVKKMALLH